jgi:hypothetical protein
LVPNRELLARGGVKRLIEMIEGSKNFFMDSKKKNKFGDISHGRDSQRS